LAGVDLAYADFQLYSASIR